MAGKFKVHKLLSREQLDKLEAYCCEPGRTIDQARAWIMSLGFTISRNAVWNWKREFDATMSSEFSRSTDLATTIQVAVDKAFERSMLGGANLAHFYFRDTSDFRDFKGDSKCDQTDVSEVLKELTQFIELRQLFDKNRGNGPNIVVLEK